MTAENFGIVKHGDKVLALTQNAYIASRAYYEAGAVDVRGERYTVRWEIVVDDIDSCDDESNACDWATYTVVKL